MAFGKIYESSWWGTAHVNNIGFGSIYKDIASSVVGSFKSRVETDGGIFEAQACLEAELKRIEDI